LVAPAVATPTRITAITTTIAVASGIAPAVPVAPAVAIPVPTTIAIPVAVSIATLHNNLSIGRQIGLAAGFDSSGQRWGRHQGQGSPQ
jgi:hypothetical protein